MKKSSTDSRSGNLEDVFRTGFGEAEVTPSANLWDRIDKQLDTVEQTSLYKKKAAFYGRMVLLSALLLLLVGGAWFYQYQQTERTTTPETVAQAKQAGAIATTDSGIAPAIDQQAPKETAKTNPETENYPAKPAENTSFPASSQDQTQRITTTNTQDNQPVRSENIRTQTNRTQASPVAQPAATSLAESVKKGRKQNSQPTKPAGKQAVGKRKTGTAVAVAMPANSGTATLQGQQAKQAGSQGQISGAAATGTPPTQISAPQTEPASLPQVAAGVPAVTEVQTVVATTPQATGNSVALPDTATEKAPSPEQPLVIIPATAAADSLANTFAEHIPGMKGNFTMSVLYAGYQFEQGLMVSNTVQGGPPPSAAYKLAAQEFNELAKPASSYRAEVRAAYWFHDKLRLETGLGFSRNRALTLSTYEIRSFIFNPNSGAMELATQSSIIEPVLAGAHRDSVAAVSVPEFETSYQYDYLSLPVRVAFQSDSHGWHWFASGGVSAARLLNSRITSTRSTTASETKHAFRNWNFAGVFSFGLGYQFNQRISFGIGPDLSYSLNSLVSSDKAGVRQANPYTMGVSGGLSYTFR